MSVPNQQTTMPPPPTSTLEERQIPVPLPPVSPSSSSTTPSFLEPTGELDGPTNSITMTAKYNLAKMSVRQTLMSRWKNMQSWGSFIDTNKMLFPASIAVWSQRLVRNVAHFQSNYMCVFVILFIYCILTSPLLLLALAAAMGACYIVTLKNAEKPLKLLGYQLSLAQQYVIVALLSLPLFYLVGAGSAVFWVIGASFFVIGLHASFYAIEQATEPSLLEEGAFNFAVQSV